MPAVPFTPFTVATPTVQDVAVLIRARTVDADSDEVGTFDTTTRPTAAQVTTYITQALAEIKTRVGENFYREEYADTATNLAAIRAAMSVEVSHYPEQIADEMSAYNTLKELYDSGAKWLAVAMLDGSPNRKGMFSVPIVPASNDYLPEVLDEEI